MFAPKRPQAEAMTTVSKDLKPHPAKVFDFIMKLGAQLWNVRERLEVAGQSQ